MHPPFSVQNTVKFSLAIPCLHIEYFLGDRTPDFRATILTQGTLKNRRSSGCSIPFVWLEFRGAADG